jgi:predicted ArsR family transcriptional regulator
MARSPVDDLPDPRRRLLMRLKLQGPATIAELAGDLEITGEAVRQQLLPLERNGWIEQEPVVPSGVAGRPAARYRLAVAGDRLFPKQYDDLLVTVVDAVRAELGDAALMRVLARITDQRVAALEPHLRGLPLDDKVAALKAVYQPNDPFIDVEPAEDGYRLIEHNCPFLDVALARPLLCSCTVSVLTRLLERRVVREERFQDGRGRCVFRIYADQSLDQGALRFGPEPERDRDKSS